MSVLDDTPQQNRVPLLLLIVVAAAVVAGVGFWSHSNPPLLGGLYPPEVRARLLAAGRLGPPAPDPSNAVADDPRAAALGKALFYDPGLSPRGDISCATCHDPTRGFADGRALARGISDTTRHTPTLWNVAYQRWQFWDGRADTLWAQAIGPIEHPAEMGSDREFVAAYLRKRSDYAAAYAELFGPLPDNPDRAAATQMLVNVAKAIAAFERRITSTASPFDRFAAALAAGDRDGLRVLTPAAQRGAATFFGRGECWVCHTGPLFSDREFHNILGAAADAPAVSITTAADAAAAVSLGVDLGRFRGVPQVLADPMNALGAYSDGASGETAAKLRYLIQTDEQLGQFKTPTLRNVARTAPYMHDGRFATLAEVVEFYATLPGVPQVGHREEFLRPVPLTPQERADLVAFLESLSDESMLPELMPDS